MELNNDFEVSAPIDEVWAVLTDVERIAPCLPGAQLQEIEGNEFRGVVKVKVGPITAQYQGAASFLEQDEAGHRAVLRAEGRDSRGAGNASAEISAQLEVIEGGTKVTVTTDLKVTGKVAQFGRGVMADVSRKLMAQFANNLSDLISSGPADAAPEEATPEARVVDAPEAEAVDLLGAAGASVFKRLVPALIAVAVVVVIVIALV